MLVRLIRERLDPWLARPDPTAPALHAVSDHLAGSVPVRLYRPGPEARDLLVFLHGGGLVSSSLATHDGVCRRLAAGTGFNLLAVDYRLAPEATYPAAHDDAHAAIAWAAGGGLPFAPRRMLAGGDSAGGLLALGAALRRAREGAALDGLALFYPLLALDPVETDPALFRIARRWMRRTYVGRGEAEELAFPAPEAALPRTFIASGGRDPTRLDAKRLVASSPAVVEHVEPRATHGFLNLAAVSPLAREQADRTIAALRAAFA